jgi:hypothetical protein
VYHALSTKTNGFAHFQHTSSGSPAAGPLARPHYPRVPTAFGNSYFQACRLTQGVLCVCRTPMLLAADLLAGAGVEARCGAARGAI